MDNILLIKHLPTWDVAVARVVGGKHATTAGRMRDVAVARVVGGKQTTTAGEMRNTNNGTKCTQPSMMPTELHNLH
jgi:hypothetical protein